MFADAVLTGTPLPKWIRMIKSLYVTKARQLLLRDGSKKLSKLAMHQVCAKLWGSATLKKIEAAFCYGFVEPVNEYVQHLLQQSWQYEVSSDSSHSIMQLLGDAKG